MRRHHVGVLISHMRAHATNSTPRIAPSAYVHPSAVLGDGVVVGPNCWVGEHVSLGRGVELRQSVVVEGHTTLGEDTTAFAFSVIGGAPQDRKHNTDEPGQSLSRLEVGARCVIREHVTINCGTCVGAGADGNASVREEGR